MDFIKFSASFFVVFSLLLVISMCDNDDSASMAMLASALRPLPSTWSTNASSSYCDWDRVKCDRFKRVLEINLNTSKLRGSLPSEFPHFPFLEQLHLSYNKFNGSVPYLNKLPLLNKLYLGNNKFQTFPPGFFQGVSSNLQVLVLSDNPFPGTWMIPREFPKFTNLTEFYAYNANLGGSLPDIFHSLPITILSLEKNNLTGPLPPSFSRSKITYLSLENQKIGLSGTIHVLSNMTSLQNVWLNNNQFTGGIPDLSNCKSLGLLQLQYNKLTGVVPVYLASLASLHYFTATHNMLQGPYPYFLQLKKLSNFDNNNFCSETEVSCDSQVTTMLEIASAWMYPYKLSLAWQGNDACTNWSYVTCNTENINITRIDLGNLQLEGTISGAFGDLVALESLYLNDNNLTGLIPESLTRLPNLKLLNVSNNNLSGIIPRFPPSVKVITTGNYLLFPNSTVDGTTTTGNTSDSPPKVKKGGIIAGIVIATIIGVIFCFFVASKIAFSSERKGSDQDQFKKDESCVELFVLGKSQSGIKFKELQQLDFGKLVTATNNFHQRNLLGKGGFGSVYKGTVQDGQEIAVKRLSRASGQGLEEFMNEAMVISKLQHRNLVRLLGCCIYGEEKMLVYEYMPNKSLDVFLFDSEKQKLLDWRKRFNIIEGISRGLLYLHRDSRLRIVHRDLKASNVLLDEDLNPKISDFGIAKIFCDNQSQANTRRVFGTYGYMSPEYAMKGLFSEKSDVFSFGVLTLEIVTGRRNSSFQDGEDSPSLLGYAWKLWSEGQISELIDPVISSHSSCYSEILRCIHVGLLCVQYLVKDRPTMSMVASMLSSEIEIESLPTPKQPPFFDERSSMDQSQLQTSQVILNIDNIF